MIILDTNVISETMRPLPDSAVMAWMNAQAHQTLFLTSVSIAEITFGIRLSAQGRKRDKLASILAQTFDEFNGRILPFDLAAAHVFGNFAAVARAQGRGFPLADGYIAAIAGVHGFAVASRDDSAFVAAGVKVIDPWA
jgi:toxin FitB